MLCLLWGVATLQEEAEDAGRNYVKMMKWIEGELVNARMPKG